MVTGALVVRRRRRILVVRHPAPDHLYGHDHDPGHGGQVRA
ncbi:hypothetical protein ABZ897_13670 [Nonomuraea sp. NPDC046802]